MKLFLSILEKSPPENHTSILCCVNWHFGNQNHNTVCAESPSIEGRAAYNCSSLKKYVWSQTYPPSYHQHIIMHGLGRKFPIGLLWVDMLAANRTDFREAWMKLAKDWASFEPFIDTTKVKKHGKREMNIGDPGKPYSPLPYPVPIN